MSDTYKATLTRGKTYYLGSRLFVGGEPQGVSQETKDYLEAHARDIIKVDGKAEHWPKFRFEKMEAVKAKTVAPETPRVRRRKPDEDSTVEPVVSPAEPQA